MGRKSSTSRPYLIMRTENGKPGYQRAIPSRLRPHMDGQIVRDAGSIYEVRQQATIKVALPTGTIKVIEDGWAKIHAQVEEIIERAQARLHVASRITVLTRVTSISPVQRHQMLDQVRYDILSADDQIRTRKDQLTGLSEVIQRVLQNGGSNFNAPTTRQAKQMAQDLERREARHAVFSDDPASFDTDVREGECDVDLDTKEMVRRLGLVANPQGLRLDPEMTEALKRATGEDRVIDGAVGALLARNNVSIPRHHTDRLQLALDVPRAQVEAHAIVQARREGAIKVTPPPPQVLSEKSSGPTLREMQARWIDLAKPRKKARDDLAIYIEAFIGLFGDIPIAEITRKMLREYRDLLAKRPRNLPHRLLRAPLRTQIEWAAKQTDCALLTPNTVNGKGLGSMSVMMEIAIDEDVIETNPCKRLHLKTNGNSLDRLPYSSEDINRLGASPVYAGGKRSIGGSGEAVFWMPMLGMFAGARLEELGQLLISDVRRQGEIHYFAFIEIDEDAETFGTEAIEKHLKTEASRREVPIHPFLISLGFLRYVALVKASGEKYLFPKLNAYHGRRTTNWCKFWSRYARKYMTRSKRKVFHSWRHGFLERLRNITGNEEAGAALAGHKKHMYGRTISLEKRYEIICKLDYPGVNLALFEQAAAALLY